MSKKVQTFAAAMIMMAAGAIFATNAAGQVTNEVLDNIGIALTVYSQGNTNHPDTALTANATGFTTAQLIKNLATISEAFVYQPGDLLVSVSSYTNFVSASDGSTIASIKAVHVAPHVDPNNFVSVEGSGTTTLSFKTTTTNGYVVTNGNVYQITIGAGSANTTNFGSVYAMLTNNVILTNGATAFTMNTNPIPGVAQNISDWTTILPEGVGTGYTNIRFTEFQPTTNFVLTNSAPPFIAVYIPRSGATPPTLIPVTNWVMANYGTVLVVNEYGQDLSTSDFTGANITYQATFDTAGLMINDVYPTNTPTGFVNLSLNPFGFATATSTLIYANVTPGPIPHYALLQVLDDEYINVSGQGYVGGTFSTTPTGTSFNGNYLGGTFIAPPSFYGDYVADPTPVVYEGWIYKTYFWSTTNLNIQTP